jgi:hypothetical protein
MPTKRTPAKKGQADPADSDTEVTMSAEARMLAKFEDMLRQHDERNSIRMQKMEDALRKEMAAIAKPEGPRIVLGDAVEVPEPTIASATVIRPWLKVLATTMPPPKLSFMTKLASFDSWRASWDAYLQTSGVMSIASADARRDRARSLLTQAFDDDLRSWTMSQAWYTDQGVNGDVDLVLERIRMKIEEEDDTYSALMARPWANNDTADAFWVDIQTKVRYCGLRDAYHTNHVLRTLWSSVYGDVEARKEFALHPKWTTADCYAKAKAMEQVKQKDGATINIVKASAYRKGRGGGGGSTGKPAKPGGRSQTPGPEARMPMASEDGGVCLNCGFEAHGQDGRCPAAGKRCNACGKTGHFGRHCPFGVPAANATTMPASRTSTPATPFVANHVYLEPTVASTQVSGPITPFYVNTLEALAISGEIGTVATATEVSVVTKQLDWQDDDAKWFGVRANFRDGSLTKSGTISGVFTSSTGERAAYVMADGERKTKIRRLRDLVVQQHKLENGMWVPVRKKVHGRPE